MPTDIELNRIYDNIDSLESQTKELFTSVASLKASVEAISFDARSISTSINNLTLSFGALKEKTDTIFASMTSLSELKNGRVESAVRESSNRIDDFKSLCASRVQSIEFKINSVREATLSDISNLNSSLMSKIEYNTSKITSLDSKLNYAMYIGVTNILAVMAWLIKILGSAKGWW